MKSSSKPNLTAAVLLLLSVLFMFGQQSWPPLSIAVQQAGTDPGSSVTLTASEDFFVAFDPDDPEGTTMYVQVSGQAIQLRVQDPKTALFAVPHLDIEETQHVTCSINGTSFAVMASPPVEPPGGTQAYLQQVMSAYWTAIQVQRSVLQDQASRFLPPDEVARVGEVSDVLELMHGELDQALDDLPSEARDIIASVMASSGILEALQSYTAPESLKGTGEGKDALDCSHFNLLHQADAFIDQGLDAMKTAIDMATVAVAAVVSRGIISVETGAWFMARLGGLGSFATIGGATTQMCLPSHGSLILVVPNSYLSLAPLVEGKIEVWADLDTLDNSVADLWTITVSLLGNLRYEMNALVQKFVFDFLGVAGTYMEGYDIPFSLAEIYTPVEASRVGTRAVPPNIVSAKYQAGFGECNELKVSPRGVGDARVEVWIYTFGTQLSNSTHFWVDMGEWVEDWPNEDVYYGDYGVIPGRLGPWIYLWSHTQGTVDPCDRRIVVDNGVLTAYGCHHRILINPPDEYEGHHVLRLWLDHFWDDQERFPMESVQWSYTSTGSLGPGGHSEMWMGTLEGGAESHSGSASVNLYSDKLCLRPPGVGASGSLYLGATHACYDVSAETNESSFILSDIVLVPSGAAEPFPPEGASVLTENFRGVTETYRPLIRSYNLATGISYGDVAIPGDFGSYISYMYGTQIHVPDCDSRVELWNGTVTIEECHHRFNFLGYYGTGTHRFYLWDLKGQLPAYRLDYVGWAASWTGDLGGGSTTFGLGFEDMGRFENGSLGPGYLEFDPPDRFAKAHDSESFPDWYLRAGLSTHTYEGGETFSTTSAIWNIRLEGEF